MIPLAAHLVMLAFAAPAQVAAEPATAVSRAAPPVVFDRIVAVVDGQPLLLSELDFETRVALIAQGGWQAAWAPLTGEDLAAGLEYALGQRLVHAEADRLQVFTVGTDEVLAAVREFAAKFPDEASFRRFFVRQEVTEEQLAAVLRRSLRVARFLDSKIKLAARVTEDELKRYYREHPHQFATRGYPESRAEIKALLARERYQTLSARQIGELRTRADVRLLDPVEPEQSAASPSEAPPKAAP